LTRFFTTPAAIATCCAFQSDLLGAAAGRHSRISSASPATLRRLGNYPGRETAVFDVRCIRTWSNICSQSNRGLVSGWKPNWRRDGVRDWCGAKSRLNRIWIEEIRRFEYKVQAGAEYAVTQPVFDLRLLENFLRRIEHCQHPVVAGFWPRRSACATRNL